jgi:hypothetical protein
MLFGLPAGGNGQVSGSAASYLPPIGGFGGGQFIAPCGATENLMGFELRAGDYIDAIRPVCVISYGPREIREPPLTLGSGLVDQVGPLGTFAVVAPGWFGGPGGGIVRALCPAATPIVIGMYVSAEGISTITVNSVHLFCGQAIATQTPATYPSAVFDAPLAKPDCGAFECDSVQFQEDTQQCPAGQVAVGVHGRAGKWLDSVGLICGAPHLDSSRTYRSVGRVAPSANPGPAIPICDAAQSARARNSPAVPSLEAQCTASKPPAVALGRVASSPSSAPIPVCDAAQSARARNSPAAASLEAQCRSVGGGQAIERSPDELAAAGKTLADNDPLINELRNRQPAGPNQRGFDIGMAAALGNTEWGPGEQKILASLTPAEQEGFKIAASFSLDRNRNPQHALIGANIADADPAVEQARTLDPDIRYWLGFDIASGIFGDPKLGADGNTATGPGSMKIRDALSAPAQKGFNASVKLHLSRRY